MCFLSRPCLFRFSDNDPEPIADPVTDQDAVQYPKSHSDPIKDWMLSWGVYLLLGSRMEA